MTGLPKDLDDAISQAQEATQVALQDGKTRVQVELVFPEIELEAQSIAQTFIPSMLQDELPLKVLFPDTGAAALARRDWGEVPFKIDDLGSSRSPVERRISPEDGQYLLVCPSSIEIAQVEKLCNLVGDRPVVLLNPRLEDIAVVGIGLAARQLRERLINNIETCYYLKPLEGAAIFRRYPERWQVWLESEDNYRLLTELDSKPTGDDLERLLMTNANSVDNSQENEPNKSVKKKGFLDELQGFWNALTR